MNFLFNCWQHTAGGRRTLEDLVAILGQQLRALGHVVGRNDDELIVGPHHYNVFFEGFNDACADVYRRMRERATKVVIVATEQPTPLGFNGGVVPEMVTRQIAFRKVAPYADAVWCLVPGTLAWYGAINSRSAYTELGHAPALERRVDCAPIYDYGFFGALTPRRARILKQFGSGVNVVSTFLPQAERDFQMSLCKVILQIRPHEKSSFVSSSRVNTALHLGRPVVAEPHTMPGAWRRIIEFAEPARLAKTAARMAARWQAQHALQMGAFRLHLSPAACVGRAIALTLDQSQEAAA